MTTDIEIMREIFNKYKMTNEDRIKLRRAICLLRDKEKK